MDIRFYQQLRLLVQWGQRQTVWPTEQIYPAHELVPDRFAATINLDGDDRWKAEATAGRVADHDLHDHARYEIPDHQHHRNRP